MEFPTAPTRRPPGDPNRVAVPQASRTLLIQTVEPAEALRRQIDVEPQKDREGLCLDLAGVALDGRPCQGLVGHDEEVGRGDDPDQIPARPDHG